MENKLPVIGAGLEVIKWMAVLVVRIILAAVAPLFLILDRVVTVA